MQRSSPYMPWQACLAMLLMAGCDPATDVDTVDTDDGFLHDPLSMPAKPTLDAADFSEAETCATCHPTHVAEWSTSHHAYAMIDPVYRELVALRQAAFDNTQDPFCMQCHSAIGTRSGDIQPGFTFDALSPITLEGVTCSSCHSVVGLERPFNAGHVLDGKAPLQGPIEDPVDNAFHESAYSPLHTQAQFCGGCHDVIETSGLQLERPFAEWTSSPAAANETTCQDCHMPARRGLAANGAPEREIHSHRFGGVDVPLSPGFIDDPDVEADLQDAATALVQSAATLSVDAPLTVAPGDVLDVVVTVYNEIEGHHFPTGTSFNRQVWIDLVAYDGDEQELFRTGDLDAQGDLRNYWSDLDPFGDEDLITLSSGLTDHGGDPTLFPWVAIEHTSPAIPARHDKTWTLFVPTTETTPGPIRIEAKLRFRAYGPYLLRAVGLDALIDRLQIIDVDTADLVVDIEASSD